MVARQRGAASSSRLPRTVRHGLLVAIEGLDGCGKSTIAHALAGREPAARAANYHFELNETVEIYNLMMRLNAAGDLVPAGTVRVLFDGPGGALRTS